MQEHYDCLGLSSDATPAQIKAAYHAKLREFPAHTHPQEFKAIRAAYEALRQGGQKTEDDFFQLRPMQVELDPEQLQRLRQQAHSQVDVSLAELMRLTF